LWRDETSSSEVLDELTERADGMNLEPLGFARLAGVVRGNEDPVTPVARRTEHEGEYAGHRPQLTAKRDLSNEECLLDLARIDVPDSA
jgi:hypothetical protein